LQVLVINPGATSTKIAVFADGKEVMRRNIEHSYDELGRFLHVVDQLPFRKALILQALAESGFSLTDFAAVAGRGGPLRHVPSGTYRVNDRAVADVVNPPYGEHPSSLGLVLARELADETGIPAFFTDPVSVDEMTAVARVSGFAGMERESFFHALNQKSVARRAAALLGKPYEKVRLIVAHMGGGVSVAAHENGLIVDVFNVKDEGCFSMDRGGSLPVSAVVNLCFSGLPEQAVRRRLGQEAGVFSYLGTKDFREAERRAFSGDGGAKLVFDALAYQLSKDIGSMAAVLRFAVDAIVLTGGAANSARLCDAIRGYVEPLARVLVLPGEEEMQSLADGAFRVLNGEAAKEY